MTEWQPIETAPKDGTWFIAIDKDDEAGGYFPPSFCHWDSDEGWDTGWTLWTTNQGWVYSAAPTHWQPLPEPPKETP